MADADSLPESSILGKRERNSDATTEDVVMVQSEAPDSSKGNDDAAPADADEDDDDVGPMPMPEEEGAKVGARKKRKGMIKYAIYFLLYSWLLRLQSSRTSVCT